MSKINLYDLMVFWNENSINGKLSTTGFRKLTLLCFKPRNYKRWKERANGYKGKPKYPFWKQSELIQNYIIAMLKIHPLWRKLVEEIEKSVRCFEKLTRFKKPVNEDERKIMSCILKEIQRLLDGY